MPLAERIAIVTGANRGIGPEVVLYGSKMLLYWLRFK